jgi:transcription initiation factor IIF auxiliary subunit
MMHAVASHGRMGWGKLLTKKRLTVKKVPPFRIEEDGWGEFMIEITLTDLAGKDHPITHDLNFATERYEHKHVLTFKNPKGELAVALRASGPVPGDAGGDLINGKKSGRISGVASADGEGKKRKKTDMRGIDMDSLAEKLQRLGEDDLLQVVQMVHDNKSEDSWMRNDVDRKCSTGHDLR